MGLFLYVVSHKKNARTMEQKYVLQQHISTAWQLLEFVLVLFYIYMSIVPQAPAFFAQFSLYHIPAFLSMLHSGNFFVACLYNYNCHASAFYYIVPLQISQLCCFKTLCQNKQQIEFLCGRNADNKNIPSPYYDRPLLLFCCEN